MKKIITLAILSTFWISNGQTVGFDKKSQEVSYSEKAITLKVTLKNYRPQDNKDPFVLELSHDAQDQTVFPNLIDGTTEIKIDPNNYQGAKEIKINWDASKAKSLKGVSFSLKKKTEDDRFSIENAFHIAYLFEKPKPSIKLGLMQSCCKTLDNSFLKDSLIILNFAVFSDKIGITKEDKVTLQLGIDNDEDFKTQFPIEFDPSDPLQEIKFDGKKHPNDFKALKKSILQKRKLELEIQKIDANDKFNLSIDKSSNKIAYEYSNNSLKNKYDIFLGSNFELQDKFSTSEFFAEINVFLPNLIHNYGLRGGIYKNNTSVKLEEDRRQETILNQIESPVDSITFETKRVNSTPTVSVENLGLYVEGLYALKKTENFNFFLGLHVEIIQRVEKYTFENEDLLTLNTQTISLEELSMDPRLIAQLSRSNTYTNRYVDSYFGLSLPTFYNHKGENGRDLEVMINPSLGIGEPGLPLRPRDGNSLSLYGFTQFHLIFGSDNGLKFKIGGEARKYFNFDQAPIITVNLSAAINLEELFKSSGG